MEMYVNLKNIWLWIVTNKKSNLKTFVREISYLALVIN